MRWLTKISLRIRDTWQYRHEPEKIRVLATVYWWTLLSLAALVFLFLAFYAGVQLYEIIDAEEEPSLLSSGDGGIPFNTAELEAVLKQFDERAARYESLKRNPPKIADPSR